VIWRDFSAKSACLNVNIKGPAEKTAFELSFDEADQLKNRAQRPSPLSRLAIVLFTTGVALLVLGALIR
jgi:hypothetical protein